MLFAGVVAVICVPAEFTATPVAATPPTVTVLLEAKLVPVMVMDVPPAVEPRLGLTEVTVGLATKVATSATQLSEVLSDPVAV